MFVVSIFLKMKSLLPKIHGKTSKISILDHFVINVEINIVKYEFGFKIMFVSILCMQFFLIFF